MTHPSKLVIPDLPFHIGATTTPSNPSGLPSTFAFELDFDRERGLLVQPASPALQEVLDRAYRVGQEIGTPLGDDAVGRPYVEDFLAFIRSKAASVGRALEIGAGVGYLSRRLADEGWKVDSIEPGQGYRAHWQKYGVEVINDYFPTPRAPGPYDLICSYAVLEHIGDIDSFLAAVRRHLAPGGLFVISVPDCGKEIVTGDPAMLIHEHYNYFDHASLDATLARAGFLADVRSSDYGRTVYAAATAAQANVAFPRNAAETSSAETYPTRCEHFLQATKVALADMSRAGSLGIYCPARALAVLPADISCRFFDDSDALQRLYIPPFAAPIESRAALLERPTDFVVIMSSTFGGKLKRELAQLLPRTRILTIDDLPNFNGATH